MIRITMNISCYVTAAMFSGGDVMRESTCELIIEAVELIEKKLKESLLLDDIANYLFVSKFHLHRMFKSLVGKTPMSYVRGRRLSSSLHELLNTKYNISVIAEEYCFNYEQSYQRAFKNQFGITPTDFRRSPRELKIVQRFDTSSVSDAAKGVITKPEYRIVPEFSVAGIIYHVSNYDEQYITNNAAVTFSTQHRHLIPSRINEHIYIGLSYPSKIDNHYFYMPCVEITDTFSVPKNYDIRTFPSQLYAVFRYIGFHSPSDLCADYLKDIYNYIFKWCATTKHELGSDYLFERMDLKVCASDYCQADIFVPLKG